MRVSAVLTQSDSYRPQEHWLELTTLNLVCTLVWTLAALLQATHEDR
jgi:hypothetical protein